MLNATAQAPLEAPPTRTVYRACPLCEACCGIRVTVEAGERVSDIRGDPEDPLSRGFICPKGVALGEHHFDPDLLQRPLLREGSAWREIDWPRALDLAAERLGAVRDAHGADSVAIYRGNPTVHNLGLLLYGPDLIRALGTRNIYTATSADQLPHMLVACWMFGHQLLLPVPDIDRARYALILGANPAASNGSMMTAPGFGGRLKALRARGGRAVLIDPRRTETARLVDAHHFIRPGTDVLLLAAMVQVILARGAAIPSHLSAHVQGLDQVAAAVAPFTPEAVAGTTGMDAETIRGLALEYADSGPGFVYGRMGTSVTHHGVCAQWLIQVLNLATGNLDTPGGVMFTTPAVDPLGKIKIAGRGSVGRWHSRVRGRPEVGGELPVAVLAEEIATPGPGQVRALLCIAGNPVLSTPNGVALDRALAGLDFMVSVDPYLNETSRHAHLILPPLSVLARDHYDLVFNLLSVRNVAKWSPRVFDPPPGALDDWQILNGLHQRLVKGTARLEARARGWLGPNRQLDLALRAGPHGSGLLPGGLTLGKVQASTHGLDLGPLQPTLPERLRTKDGRIQAAPPAVLEDLGRAAALLEPPHASARGFDLVLIGRRHLKSNNSWLHNTPRLMRGRDRCTLLMHPSDANRRGLATGDTVRVRSKVGEVSVPIDVTEQIMPGVVSLPHGYGHGRQGLRLGVAAAHPGVSMNDLTDAAEVDEVGGTAVLTGVPVAVSAASTPAGEL